MTAAETTPAAEAMMAAETIPAEATIPEVAARARALEAEPVLPVRAQVKEAPEKCQRRVEQIPQPEPVQP